METIQKGKQTKKKKKSEQVKKENKNTKKEERVEHGGRRIIEKMQSCIACRVRYAMHQSTWKSFRDALEMHQKSTEFDMQGCTLTLRPLLILWVQSDLALVHCPSINRSSPEGETTNKQTTHAQVTK